MITIIHSHTYIIVVADIITLLSLTILTVDSLYDLDHSLSITPSLCLPHSLLSVSWLLPLSLTSCLPLGILFTLSILGLQARSKVFLLSFTFSCEYSLGW